MDDYMNYNYFQAPPPGNEMFPPPSIGIEENINLISKTNDPPPPPPIVICPTEVDNINVTLEKNQQCECKDCGKLFNSVWYLKQHAVKHSNDRPFQCKFCQKTYKFRSNLYQHKCPERQKSLQQRRRGNGNTASSANKKSDSNPAFKMKVEPQVKAEDHQILMPPPQNCFSEGEDNDAPITYGLVIQNYDQNQMQQQQIEQQQLQSNMYQNFPMTMPQIHDPLMNDMENKFDNVDFDSVRGQQLPSQQIEDFVQKNKQKLYSCRKCRVFLPTEEALLRHNASHSGDEIFPYKCANCRQAFESEKELRRHTIVHALDEGPWRCDECCGQFRSSVALRRHKDQCRPCFLPPVQNNIMVSVHSPFDPFSFIPADNEHLFLPVCDDIANATDSGIGSEGSPNSISQSSPERAGMSVDEAFTIIRKQKKEKEDDEDSGFRSRLNSVNQSCSPDSFHSNGESPLRKLSGGPEATSQTYLGAYGTGPTYGTRILYEQSCGGVNEECQYGLIKEQKLVTKQEIISLQKENIGGVDIAIAPIVYHRIQPVSLKEMVVNTKTFEEWEDLDVFSNDKPNWGKDGYDREPEELYSENERKRLLACLIMMYVYMVLAESLKMAANLALLASLM